MISGNGHDPATAEPHSLKDKGFITTSDWHEIVWEIRLGLFT